jgi:serine/threonine protein phosphatase 1
MFAWPKASNNKPATPGGYRAYAVGDIHGRLDLLERLLESIEADLSGRPSKKNLLVFLGDLIDRGPDSKGVIERLRSFRHDRLRPVFLAGNHEEILLRILAGETGLLQNWLRFGGAECLASYGVTPADLGSDESESLAAIRSAVPQEHAGFLASFSDTLTFGDYLFVHAGVRPGVDLRHQSQSDLRWIRSPFLEDETDHGAVVVHGHTISGEVEHRPNRIGIDTGAYRTGVLTALGLEGTSKWTLNTAGGINELAASD